jgi:plasmid stabilization system protein ParE
MVIDWTFNARENIRSIRDYLEGEKVHQNTINEVVRDIIDAPTRLKEHPKSGRKLPEIDQENFREILHNKYRIIYFLPDDAPQKIYILNVIHGRQDIQPFLSQIWQRFLN